MNNIDSKFLLSLYKNVIRWFEKNVSMTDTVIQIFILFVCVALSVYLGRQIKAFVSKKVTYNFGKSIRLKSLYESILDTIGLMISIVLIFISKLTLKYTGHHWFIVDLTGTLFSVWLFIRVVSSLSTHKFWANAASVVAWLIAALHIVGVLDEVVKFLGETSFQLGKINISFLSLIKASVTFSLLFLLGNWLGNHVERKLHKLGELPPSTSVLLTKIMKMSIFVVIFFVAIHSSGIDLTTLAVFSGAIGVGIGFGLQKVVANLISGIILLLDKSIKPGDVIQIGDVYGWITGLRSRYVSVVTRDGKEFLIPNEDLITQQVVNWSFTHSDVRLSVSVGISYESDLEKAMKVVLDSVKGVDRVLLRPGPACLINGFGDSSIDLDLYFWINDPEDGVANVKSDIYLKIWNGFKEHKIQIPFPQRDVHVVNNQNTEMMSSS